MRVSSVRFDQLTEKERRYARAMASLGPGPQKSGDIAAVLNVSVQSLGTLRKAMMEKGTIYSPDYGIQLSPCPCLINSCSGFFRTLCETSSALMGGWDDHRVRRPRAWREAFVIAIVIVVVAGLIVLALKWQHPLRLSWSIAVARSRGWELLSHKEAQERSIQFLVQNLSSAQRKQYKRHGYFDVIGGDTGKRYRIRDEQRSS